MTDRCTVSVQTVSRTDVVERTSVTQEDGRGYTLGGGQEGIGRRLGRRGPSQGVLKRKFRVYIGKVNLLKRQTSSKDS